MDFLLFGALMAVLYRIEEVAKKLDKLLDEKEKRDE